MSLLPIGSVVTLKGGEHKVMIISRYPLTNRQGTIGYFQYGGCLYPEGQVESETYFFNQEDIQDIHFEGYKDDSESALQQKIEQELPHITYPQFFID
ncbi:MAG: DUF4176 domain-containing protein [Eggerthellaceae bacterium]|nr:DUF4176 domain-containing protein [Eggerthellaceae bacterium]